MRAAKIDEVQPRIVEALRKIGATVQSLARIGNGCPDLLVCFRRRLFLFEVKSEKGRLTRDQKRWHALWGMDVDIVRSEQEAIDACYRGCKK
jgi:hypothetical protein